jgi:serine/threonine-protein kinase
VIPEAQRSFGDIYFILGNCYYYQPGEPDYHTAREYFEIGLQYVTDNPAYYRDYAVTLARTGRVDEAERILKAARDMGLDSASIDLIRGEIAFAKQEYGASEESLSRVIATSTDDYLRYRAFCTMDEIYRLLGQPERSVELLEGALVCIPLSRVPEMQERLADACVKAGDYEKAVALFEEILEAGAPQFHIMQNLAILYQNLNEFDKAAAVLAEMADAFPQDYRVPMRQAYLEADRQSAVANENRDYTLTKQYYEQAKALYEANVRPGEMDAGMQKLEGIIEQLRANKWID